MDVKIAVTTPAPKTEEEKKTFKRNLIVLALLCNGLILLYASLFGTLAWKSYGRERYDTSAFACVVFILFLLLAYWCSKSCREVYVKEMEPISK
jgi:hypothetical protein